MIRRYLPCIAVAALSSTPAFAASPTFSYLDLAYVTAGDGADGGGLRASAAIGSRVFIQLDSAVRDHMDGTVGHASLGAGLRWPISDAIVVAFGLSADLVGGSFEGRNDSGWSGIGGGAGASVELRACLNRHVELNAGARYESVTDQVMPSAGARFYFSRGVGAGLRVVHDNFDTRVDLALHINFGD
ncbi:MAG: hypothetical protein ABIQ86_01600 [Steroidobacteraceae bacterium]